MTARTCPLCGATLADDTELDPGCAGRLKANLRAVPGILDELETTLARIGSTWREPGGIRGRATGGCKPGCDHADDNPSCVAGVTLDVNLAASEAALQLRTVLHGWVRVWDEETPAADVIELRARTWSMATASRQATLLAQQPLAGRPWAAELAREVDAAVRKAERAIDTPPEATLAGRCGCGTPIYTRTGDTKARCSACGVEHDVRELYDAMVQARGALQVAPAAVIARMLIDPATGQAIVTAAQIRGWRYREALEVVETNAAGQPCYSVAAVAWLAKNGAPERTDETMAETSPGRTA